MKSHSGAPFSFSKAALDEGFDPASVTVEPVNPVDEQFGRYGGRCLLLRNLLSPRECSFLIEKMSPGLDGVGYRRDYRRCNRAVLDSPDLAEVLWQRIGPFTRDLSLHVDLDPAKQRLLSEEAGDCPECVRVGLGDEGTWHPKGLNECFRFCQYEPGGFFRPHCDGSFKRSEHERSLFTCMIYLDGAFEGGQTRFLRPSGTLAEDYGLEAAAEERVLASIQPEPGLCILFFQPGLLHEGQDLTSGVKHMLRTDVMFCRDEASRPQRSSEEEQALDFVRRAESLEELGTAEACNEACRLYRRAFKLYPALERML